MTKSAFLYLILFLFLGGTTAGCWGCFGSDDEASSETMTEEEGNEAEEGESAAPENLTEAMEQAQQAVQNALSADGEGGKITKSVDFRKIKDLLPDEVDGLDRTGAEGQRSGAFGVQVSTATGKYEDGDQRLEIVISDLGTLSAVMRFAQNAWLQAEIDREHDRGFERTRKFRADGKDYPSFEQFEGEGDEGNCEIQVWVAERFIVQVEGRNVEMELCEEARDEIGGRGRERDRSAIGADRGSFGIAIAAGAGCAAKANGCAARTGARRSHRDRDIHASVTAAATDGLRQQTG